MNYPFKSFTSLVYISFLIQKGGIHLCRDNSWCVTKQYSTEKTGSHLHLSVRRLSVIYSVKCSHSNLMFGKLSHHIFKPEHTGSKQIYTFNCAHAALSALMDFYFQGPTGLRAAWCKDDWFPSRTFECKSFPSCRYAQWFKDMTWGTLTVWRSTESSPHQQTHFIYKHLHFN